ncbi:16S rRNA methyltransferase [Roseovarius atlanticus]|uniref:Ribosomal RNA small subunit methyltransferase I n=1 Tax=Roseovarius atlanticus TaxID=1641875 RepID=A0A0T5NUT4_9RHOB|nr:16S rRNA (cytidine(1402)-2'-O)-methyltransferase [Roseovarius atlanticus]KRS12660.1 16S rRNA methyltransferase [Roseovarius atlanticus]
MNPDKQSLAPGLYLVATPIGAARDITLRTLDILTGADVLAAEDTRSLRRLMEIHGVKLNDRPLVSYHDHNGDRARPRLMAALEQGKSVVYASEAGTPMVADPGYDLARAAVAEGHALVSAPGPSAVVTALTVAGLPTDRFFFAGFLPSGGSKRKSALKEVAGVPGTLVFYESPKRLAAMLRDAAEVLGAERQAAVCRELTKKFEEVLRGTLGELAERLEAQAVKGEIVVVIERGLAEAGTGEDLDTALSAALETQSVRDAADTVAARLGLKRRVVYQRALELSC